MTSLAPATERVSQFLATRGTQDARVIPLTGDASDRKYFRVLPPEAEPLVLQVYGEPFAYDRLPFVNVASLLAEMSLPVPAMLGHDEPLGILAMEDLGDVTLQAHVGTGPTADHAALYRQAVGYLATLQHRGVELASPRYLPYSVAFDVEKLTWEMDFFLKHFLEAYRGARPSATEREALREELLVIVHELAGERRVLCHRDYHSRNLMLHRDRLVLIDFQDARLGPDTYDLVSLLRDSYVDLGEPAVEELIAYFLALRGDTRKEREFRDRFDVMALQRNLKALGTFGYQTTARGNPVYIQYIPRTIRYVADNLRRHARFARLREVLGAFLPEIRTA